MARWFTIFSLFILSSSAEKNVLEGFDENTFSTDLKNLEIYRFTYLPTFDKPCLFRLDVLSENSGTLTIKQLSGKGGYPLRPRPQNAKWPHSTKNSSREFQSWPG